jgi:hypothetical protein
MKRANTQKMIVVFARLAWPARDPGNQREGNAEGRGRAVKLLP